MLKEIYIENLAVIKKAAIPFTSDLNVFTGETGAGKSILINGINAVLGQRCSKDIVRSGCEKAVITALFTDLEPNVKAKLDELGICCDGDELTLTREISRDGGSVARINGRTASVSVMKEIGCLLINIHGQHDSQVLLDSERHIKILDTFDGEIPELDEYRTSFKELQSTARKLGELKKREADIISRKRTLKEIIKDMADLELYENEDEALEKEYEDVREFERLAESIETALHLIQSDDGASRLLIRSADEIEEFSGDGTLKPLYERLQAAEIEVSDIAGELRHFASRLNVDTYRLEQIKSRLAVIRKLERKYLCDCNGLVKMYAGASEELDSLDSMADEIDTLKAKKEEILKKVSALAKAVSERRAVLAEKFVRCVTAELEFLNMPNVTLEVRHERDKLTVNGMDTVEFLISANKGEQPKPIAKIASGGELSRIMLALKSVIAERDGIPTMIFDEIDTGVSGKAAQKIGIKLREIGRVRQVLCVTHLPQIAVMANTHFLIEKTAVDERTETEVRTLDFNGRTAEIARIMGGENPSELMLETAKEQLLEWSADNRQLRLEE